MPRIVKEPDQRRNEILDVAQTLIYTKGYEQMSIQDILDRLQISKGAFYHYFDSKQSLLDDLIDRLMEDAERVIGPISADPTLPALEKMKRVFNTAASWKVGKKEFMLALLKVWYADENAIVRQKLQARYLKESGHFITDVIEQGIREGVFHAVCPEHLGSIALGLVLNVGDRYAELILAGEHADDWVERIQSLTSAYTEAFERVLGAPSGSIELIDMDSLMAWFESPVAGAE